MSGSNLTELPNILIHSSENSYTKFDDSFGSGRKKKNREIRMR